MVQEATAPVFRNPLNPNRFRRKRNLGSHKPRRLVCPREEFDLTRRKRTEDVDEMSRFVGTYLNDPP